MDQGTDFSNSGIGDWNNFNQTSGINGLGPDSGEKRFDINVPLGHQPQEGLERDDGPRPNEGPLLALDVGIIALLGQVEGEKDRPNDQKWQNIGMELCRKRIVQGRMLNLGVIC